MSDLRGWIGLKRFDPRVKDTASPFTAQVLEHPLPECFMMPNIPTYDGKPDHGDHLDIFKSLMLLLGARPEVICLAFSITLSGSTEVWYQKIKPNLGGSQKQLTRKFMEYFGESSF